MLQHFLEIIPNESTTLLYAGEGFAIALACAMATLALEWSWRPASLITRSILVTVYALPPFAIVFIAISMKFEDETVLPLAIAAAVSFPLTVLLGDAIDIGNQAAEGVLCGSALQRLLRITIPAASPSIAFAFATCVPWLLLASMLSEMATSMNGGIGIRFMNAVQRGWQASTPYEAAVISASALIYLLFVSVGGTLRRVLSVHHRDMNLTRSIFTDLRSPALETMILFSGVGVFWVTIHANADLIAPGPLRIWLFVTSGKDGLLTATMVTGLLTVVSLAFGAAVGSLLALIAKAFRYGQALAWVIVFPLQILPIFVFTPFLIAFQLFLEDVLWHGAIRAPHNWIGLVPDLMPSLLIGSLASAYAFYDVGKTRLWLMPLSKGPMLESRRRYNWQVIRMIYFPWVAIGFRDACDVAMPRTLLAILVTEILVTAHGLGGRLTYERARSHFTGAWSVLLLLLLVLLCLRFLTNPKLSLRSSAIRRGIR